MEKRHIVLLIELVEIAIRVHISWWDAWLTASLICALKHLKKS